MKYIKLFEHLMIDEKNTFGIHLKTEIGLNNGVDGYIDFDYYNDDGDFNRLHHPNHTQYIFRFRYNADLTKITDFLIKYKIQYNIFSGNDTIRVSFYIKNEIIEEYTELINSTDKYNI